MRLNYFPRFYLFFLLLISIFNSSHAINNSIENRIINANTSQKIFEDEKIKAGEIADPPDVDFTFTNNNSCSGTAIQFTSNVSGTGPFTYTWNFGDGQTSTDKDPTHSFVALGCGTQIFNVTLTVLQDTIPATTSKQITVIQKPDISFSDENAEIGEEDFNNCSYASNENPNYSIRVKNNSASKACIDSYNIDWGDGTKETNVTFPIDHEYTTLGAFNMVITAKGSNNCENSVLYIVKNQTNPSGGIISPGTTQDLCAPTNELDFAISGWGTNSPGTTYSVDYGDGTAILMTQEEMVASSYYYSGDPASSANFPIPHSYTTSSCPTSSFTVNLTIVNACSSTPAAVGNITIITKPEPDFTAFPTCVNSNTLFTNKTMIGNGKNCTSLANYTWDFGDGSPLVEQNNTLPKDITHTYTTPGVYDVTLTAINNSNCGEIRVTKPITISPPPTAEISGSTNVCQGDESPTITFTGADGIAPYTFTYKINDGSNQTISTAENSDSVSIDVPTTMAGIFTYSLVDVSASGCSQPQSGDAVVEVISAVSAAISGTDTVCINSASPLILFKGLYGQAPYTFTYNINGGTSKTITTVSGDTVSIQAPTNIGGIFNYILTDVEDNNVNASVCTIELKDTVSITVNDQLPEPMVLDDYEFCNGETTPQISFSNSVPGTTYTWTNSNTSIGLTANGSGNIESFTAQNNTSNSIATTLSVTPFSLGCNGDTQTFTITVHPATSVLFSEEDQGICSGEISTEVTLSSETSGVDLSWEVEQPTGISETLQLTGANVIPFQILTNTTNEPIDITYKAKASLASATTCSGIENIYTITVFPKPKIKETLTDTICSGYGFDITPTHGGNNIVPTGTKYTWDDPVISPDGALAGYSRQDTPVTIIGQTIQNTTTTLATATYTVTPMTDNCTGETFKVTVYVIPNTSLTPVSDITLCTGDFQEEITFGYISAGTNLKWTSDNPNIGMVSTSGSDRISSFIATNSGTSPEKATITVESNSEFGNSSCDVSQIQFSITVNPEAQVDNPGTQNVCDAELVSIPFSTVNTGGTTTYEWTNSNTDIGLEAFGEGEITFNAFNGENSVITSLISVTPTFTNNGLSCKGKTEQFRIEVSPPVIVDQPESQSVCSENLTSEILFSGNHSDIVYNWNINNTSIGLSESGTGNIPEFMAFNDESDSVVAVITVTPSLNGCVGEPKNFNITVYPSAVILKQPSPSSICLGEQPVPLSVKHTTGVSQPNYQWYSNTSNSYIGASLIPNETNSSYIPPATSTNAMYYFCEIDFPGNGGCSSITSDIVKVKVRPNPIIVLNDEQISRGEDLKICPNEEIQIYVRGADTYEWSYGMYGDSIFISLPGDYRVVGISEAGCRDTFPFSVSNYDFWNYSIESDKEEVTNEQVPVVFSTQNVPGSYYYWDFGDGTTALGSTAEHIFDIKEDGFIDVHLKVENPDGCIEEANKKIGVNITSLPNTFTPNGDGINDIFLRGWKIEVFNRNGVLFYKGYEGWDGTYRGKPVAPGTYFYVLYDKNDSGEKPKKNYVTIIR